MLFWIFPIVTRGLFAGFSKDSKQLDTEVHRKYIYGGHVAAYMRTLMEDEPKKYRSHFNEYVKRSLEPNSIKGMYKKVHVAIRSKKNQGRNHTSINAATCQNSICLIHRPSKERLLLRETKPRHS